jgi:uncharacterized protein (UPF0276 family)
VNVGADPGVTLAALPRESVAELHLAGHLRREIDGRTLLIDDHGSLVDEAVWALYAQVLDRFGPVATLIEWDTDVPPPDVLLAEAARADRMLEVCLARAA